MPYFNRFDIAEAYYLFARHHHSRGDTSDNIFNRLSRLHFEPGLSLRQHEDPALALSENGAEIYAELVAHHPDAAHCPECGDRMEKDEDGWFCLLCQPCSTQPCPDSEDSCPHYEGEGGTGVVLG